MARTSSPEKRQHWHSIVSAYEEFTGSQAQFCKLQGISKGSLNYWRERFTEEPMKAITRPSFATVEVEPLIVHHKSMPDSKWVAEIIFELHSRVNR